MAPTLVSLGNHEWMLSPEDLRFIEQLGCTVLDNSWVRQDGLVIGGLSSARVTDYRRWRKTQPSFPPYPYHGTPSRSEVLIPETGWLDSFCDQDGYHILLCHHPEYWTTYLRHRKIQLVLSGHAHGGQWRFFDHGVYAPGQGLWPELTAGIVDGRLVISRGLSNGKLIPRINNPVEMVYVR